MKYLINQLFILVIVTICNSAYSQTNNRINGQGSGESIISGYQNTMIGDSIAPFLTNAKENTLLGFKSGFSINGYANYNTFIGNKSGHSTTYSDYNVFIGHSAGFSNTTASENVFIGNSAGFSNLTGTDNTFIGFEAGKSNNSTDNTFIGNKSGLSNTSGRDNTFIGEESGKSNTTGNDNVFIGEDSGYHNTDGDDNTFIGSTAGRANSTGIKNTFIGNEAGYDNETGNRNTFVGDSAGVDCGNGNHNTFLGQAAGASTENASRNTFIGAYSGWENNRTNSQLTANDNTYLGYRTGYTNRTGQMNVGIGANSDFRGNYYGRNERNTFIGANIEVNASDAVLLGYNSKVSDSKSIALGANTNVYSGNAISLGHGSLINSLSSYSIAIGHLSEVKGYRSAALGDSARVYEKYSMALGSYAIARQKNSFIIGSTDSLKRMSVGIGTEAPNLNASLDLAESNKGFMISRMDNTELSLFKDSLDTTDEGMMVYNHECDTLFIWNGTKFVSTSADSQELLVNNDTLSISNSSYKVNLKKYLDNTDSQNLTEAILSDKMLTIGIENGNSVSVDLSSLNSGDKTPPQTLNLNNNILEIKDGNSVDMSPLLSDLYQKFSELTTQVNNQNNLIESQSTLIENLNNKIEELSTEIEVLKNTATSAPNLNQEDKAILKNCNPNPSNGHVIIPFYLPYTTSSASIILITPQGQKVKEFNITTKGHNKIEIPEGELNSGQYLYTLIKDNSVVDTKKLIIK